MMLSGRVAIQQPNGHIGRLASEIVDATTWFRRPIPAKNHVWAANRGTFAVA